jgi:hypothetical protein
MAKYQKWVDLPDGMTVHTPRGVFKGKCPEEYAPRAPKPSTADKAKPKKDGGK